MDTICNIQGYIPKAPELMLDLLMANGAPLSSYALCRAGTIMDINEATVRVALNRLCEQGKLCQPRRGVYAISAGPRALFRDVDTWRSKERSMTAWNGDWVAVHDTLVQRSDKTAWRRHCLALALRGFAQFEPGLQLRPDNLEGGIGALRTRLAELGLSAHATLFRLTCLDEATHARVKELWKVDALARQYAAMSAALDAHGEVLRREDTIASLRASLLLGREAIGLLVRDPLLPPQLMAPQARQTLLAAATRYQEQALRRWRNWISDIGSPR